MIRKKLVGLVVMALFLISVAGVASAASLDLPKWVIVPEDSSFSDVTLFCPLDAMDVTNNVTPCYVNGALTNITITFNTTTGYPKLATGKILNAFLYDEQYYEYITIPTTTVTTNEFTVSTWIYLDPTIDTAKSHRFLSLSITNATSTYFWTVWSIYSGLKLSMAVQKIDGTWVDITFTTLQPGKWYYLVARYRSDGTVINEVYDESGNLVAQQTLTGNWRYLHNPQSISGVFGGVSYQATIKGKLDEFRIYNKILTDDEIKLLLLAGRKKLSEPANFRQIFSPMIDLTRQSATFYAGLEVSTSDPNGYVPVPESAVNLTVTSAPKLISDYTGAQFYYEGHFWMQAQDVQYSVPIQFETVRESGNFSHEILLDSDSKTFVYEKEFKVVNPTGARINVVYEVNPVALGFSPLDYPNFDLDGVRMAEWSPSNSSTTYLIHTDVLEPGEISTHWIKSTWTITKQEVEFPASFDDFKGISNWSVAEKLAKNAVEGKTDTYVKVIKIDSTADLANTTVLVPLKDVEDESDVIEAVALTGSRETLQVEKLEDKIVVRVPGEAFVSGHAEIKVLYNKSGGSWFSQLLEKIRSLMKKILSMFGLG